MTLPPSTGGAQPIFIPGCGLEKGMWNSIEVTRRSTYSFHLKLISPRHVR